MGWLRWPSTGQTWWVGGLLRGRRRGRMGGLCWGWWCPVLGWEPCAACCFCGAALRLPKHCTLTHPRPCPALPRPAPPNLHCSGARGRQLCHHRGGSGCGALHLRQHKAVHQIHGVLKHRWVGLASAGRVWHVGEGARALVGGSPGVGGQTVCAGCWLGCTWTATSSPHNISTAQPAAPAALPACPAPLPACLPACRRGGCHLQRRAAGHPRVPQPGAGGQPLRQGSGRGQRQQHSGSGKPSMHHGRS